MKSILHPLKASLLATAIVLGLGAASVSADDTVADRTVGEVVEDATITAAIKTRLLADTRTEGFDMSTPSPAS